MNVNNIKKTSNAYAKKGKRGFQEDNPGRPKGAKNKFTGSIKEMVLNALNDKRVGGEEEFVKWIIASKRNKELFYTWLMKMLPSNVDLDVTGDLTVRQEFEDRLDEYFEEQGRDGIAKFFKGLGATVVPRNQRQNH